MKWLQIKNATEQAPAELFIYGEIGDWWEELDAKSLADKLKSAQGDSVTVRINSGGGSVFTATGFYSLLRSSGKKINVIIDGLAASAATIIACAGDTVTMPVNALYMVHNPLTMAYGNADEMRETADLLDTVRDAIVATYKQKTGLDDNKIIEMMDNETWLSANEAHELGFVDEILETMQLAASTKEVVNLSSDRLKNIPKDFLNHVKSEDTQHKGRGVMDLQTLKAEHADIYNAVKAESKTDIENAVNAERERITAINEAALPDQADLAQEAIKNGLSVGEFAIQALKATKKQQSDYIENRKTETEPSSKVEDVPAVENKKATESDLLASALEKAFEGV